MLQALDSALLLLCPALVIVGGVHDLVTYKIPNWISIALVAAFAVTAAVALCAGRASAGEFGLSLAVGAGALLIGFAMFALNWIGGGDAKLFAAAALWLGWNSAPTYVLTTAIAGGALSLLVIAMRSAPARAILPAGPAWFARLAEPTAGLPYGVAIAAGALAAFPQSTLVKAVAAL